MSDICNSRLNKANKRLDKDKKKSKNKKKGTERSMFLSKQE